MHTTQRLGDSSRGRGEEEARPECRKVMLYLHGSGVKHNSFDLKKKKKKGQDLAVLEMAQFRGIPSDTGPAGLSAVPERAGSGQGRLHG